MMAIELFPAFAFVAFQQATQLITVSNNLWALIFFINKGLGKGWSGKKYIYYKDLRIDLLFNQK